MEELLDEISAQVPLCCRACDNDTCRRRDEKCRNLRDKPLADGQQCVGLECLHRSHIPLKHTNDKAAANIDHHDNDGGDCIAFDELRCTIHRAEKIRLTLDFLTAALCLCVRDRPLIKIGIDGHLFAGHRVEGESCRHFGDTFRPLRDNNEVDNNEDDKHDKADDCIAADDEVAECCNHLTGIGIEKNQTRG